MYQILLTRKYLLSKVMPLLAAAAVMLCTATELIVWSVMGGFLDTLKSTGRETAGDVSISWPIVGFPHYADLIGRLEARAEIAHASPMIETLAVLNLPDGRIKPIEIKGIDPESYARVTNYAETIWWKPIETPHEKDKEGKDWRLLPLGVGGDPDGPIRLLEVINRPEFLTTPESVDRFYDTTWEALHRDGLRLREVDPVTGEERPALVLGIEVAGYNVRQAGGWYLPAETKMRTPDGRTVSVRTFLPMDRLTLSLVPTDSHGRLLDLSTLVVPVANEFRTGIYQIDANAAYMELGALQRALHMHEAERLAPIPPGTPFPDPEVVGIDPARVTTVLVRASAGVSLEEAKRACVEAYAAFAAAHADVPSAEAMSNLIETFEDKNAMFISAVEKETVLVMFIFGVVSLTSVFLVLSIFWAMISEKTRDIGILRALGAGRGSIAGLWIGYGFALGLTGSLLGVVAAMVIVRNINPIHEWLGAVMGIQIWDPAVYYFVRIPNEIDPSKLVVIFVSGIVASVLGSAWPAIRAALMDPVRALRFE